MTLTAYHAKLFAHELTKRSSSGNVDKLASALSDAQVDLNPPYMALVIEATDESGPCGLPAISVCHYGEQNGDLMRDPEMCFELGFANGPHLNAFYYLC
jgi:hypothetical protein